MIFTFDNKVYSKQPAPSREILYLAVDEASEYCQTLSYEIKRTQTILLYPKYPNVKNFYSDCFSVLSKKILAVKKLESKYRNEVNSICRDLTEIIIDGSWIWYYFEVEKNNGLAEILCKQFYLNPKAHFIYNFKLNKSLYLQNPFFKKYYSLEKLEKQFQSFQKIVGTYKYQKKWRIIKGEIDFNQAKWKNRCEKAALVMEQCANLKNSDLYHNLSLLSAFSHWDGFQVESEDREIEEAVFDHNLNAHIGLIHDMINLGYHILSLEIPEKLRILRQRIIW